MNTRLLFGLLCLTPTLCFGALSTTTSYFLNVEALTNVTARSAVRGLTGAFTNGITSGASTFNNGTVTASTPVMDTSQTWNNAGVTFIATKINITNTASGNNSLLQDWQMNNVSLAFVRKDGVVAGNALWVRDDASPLYFGGSFDTRLYRDGAANVIQQGADSATPSAQTFKGPDGSGSNIAGGALRLDGGYSTGTGAGGSLIFRTANSAGGTSSSVNTPSERFHGIPKWVTLTSATATTLFTIPVPATNYVGLTATVTIYATDGTDHQSKTSVITVDAIAKTTTITPTISQVDNTTAASAGTLTCTYTAVDNTSNVLAVKATADSSLTETVLRAKIVITAINASGTGLVTEQ